MADAREVAALRAEAARLTADNARLREACEGARAMLPERYFGALYLKLTAALAPPPAPADEWERFMSADLAPPTFPAPEDEAAFADGYTAAYRDAPEQTQTQTRGNIAMGPERRDRMAGVFEVRETYVVIYQTTDGKWNRCSNEIYSQDEAIALAGASRAQVIGCPVSVAKKTVAHEVVAEFPALPKSDVA